MRMKGGHGRRALRVDPFPHPEPIPASVEGADASAVAGRVAPDLNELDLAIVHEQLRLALHVRLVNLGLHNPIGKVPHALKERDFEPLIEQVLPCTLLHLVQRVQNLCIGCAQGF